MACQWFYAHNGHTLGPVVGRGSSSTWRRRAASSRKT